MSVIALPVTPMPRFKPVPRSRRFGLLSLWYERHQYRIMLRDDLLPEPDSVLEDAGISRDFAKLEAQKPFWRA
ncbi:MAG: DUF1127 domain-containing protein [Pseudomonadota bacterium]